VGVWGIGFEIILSSLPAKVPVRVGEGGHEVRRPAQPLRRRREVAAAVRFQGLRL
jgi:hypothetical protein